MKVINTAAIENLAIGSTMTFGYDRFSVMAKRVDDLAWTFDLLTSDMAESGNWAQVYTRNGQTLTAHADYDNGESFTSGREHYGPRTAILDALVILTIG